MHAAQFEMDELKHLLKLKDAEVEESRCKVELEMTNKDTSTPVSGNPSLKFHSSLSTVNEPSLCQLQQYQSSLTGNP